MNSKKVFILLCVIGFILYLNSLKGDFVFDDYPRILNNPAIKDLSNLKLIWLTFNTRFLTGLSFAINYKLGGLNPMGYHIVNVIIHILTAFSVYIFTQFTLQTSYFQNKVSDQSRDLIAVGATLIFLTHPIQTEAVSYITQRATSLATFFYLASLVLYIKSRSNNNVQFLIVSVITTILGMLTKEMTFTIPITIMVYEIFFLKAKTDSARQVLNRLRPFFWTLLIIPLVLALDQYPHSNLGLRDQVLKGGFHLTHCLTQINILRTYLRLFILPVRQNIDYDYSAVKGLLDISMWGSLFLLVLLGVLAILFYKRMRIVSFCIAWFFITTSIEFIVNPFICSDIVIFEHYLYLPMVGFSIALSYSLFSYLREYRKVIVTFSLCVFVFSIMTYQRNKVWENGIALWSDAVKKSPHKPRPYSNLGYHYSLVDEYDLAINNYKRALQISPNYTVYNHLGDAYFHKRDYNNSIRYYRRHITFSPNDASVYSKLCSVFAEKGDYEQAIQYGRMAVNLDPQKDFFYNNLGIAYAKKGDFDTAINLFQTALKLNPDNIPVKHNLDMAIQRETEFIPFQKSHE